MKRQWIRVIIVRRISYYYLFMVISARCIQDEPYSNIQYVRRRDVGHVHYTEMVNDHLHNSRTTFSLFKISFILMVPQYNCKYICQYRRSK